MTRLTPELCIAVYGTLDGHAKRIYNLSSYSLKTRSNSVRLNKYAMVECELALECHSF